MRRRARARIFGPPHSLRPRAARAARSHRRQGPGAGRAGRAHRPRPRRQLLPAGAPGRSAGSAGGGVRRETASAYLKAAGIAVRPPGAWGRRPPNPANEVSTDPEANPANGVSTDSAANPANEVSTDSTAPASWPARRGAAPSLGVTAGARSYGCYTDPGVFGLPSRIGLRSKTHPRSGAHE